MRLLFSDEIQPGCEGSPVLAARSVALGKNQSWVTGKAVRPERFQARSTVVLL